MANEPTMREVRLSRDPGPRVRPLGGAAAPGAGDARLAGPRAPRATRPPSARCRRAAFAELADVGRRRSSAALAGFCDYERINYLMLMMVDPNVHFHVIPRYSGARVVRTASTFADAGWPGPPDLEIGGSAARRSRSRRCVDELSVNLSLTIRLIVPAFNRSLLAQRPHEAHLVSGESKLHGESAAEARATPSVVAARHADQGWPRRRILPLCSRKCRTRSCRSTRGARSASPASPRDEVMFVRSGILSKYKTDGSGRRQIVALRFPGEGILPREGDAEYGIQAIVRSEVHGRQGRGFRRDRRRQPGACALLLAADPAQRGDRLRMAGQLRPPQFDRAGRASAVRDRGAQRDRRRQGRR